jgi:8-oxo-dGTP pyrophosphatase MutT (NUDIX family)
VAKDFIKKLSQRLQQPLPGMEAHLKLAPYKRLFLDYPDINAMNPKIGSVLILLYPSDSDFSMVYIKRTEYKGVHSGQISFPGGRFEPEDISLETTALREAREETGADDAQITILGKLSNLYIPPSNFLVSPYVGFTDQRPFFIPDAREVESIIEVKLSEFLTALDNVSEKQIQTTYNKFINAPYFDIKGYHVWGATGMISCEFAAITAGL